VTGTTLPRDLEVYVFGQGIKAMSVPLLMPIANKNGKVTEEGFLQTVIHEIVHRFSSSENNRGIAGYWEQMRNVYGNESQLTRNHIFVYAVLNVVGEKLFGPKWVAEINKVEHPDYARAVEIVQKEGAQTLIDTFRSFLK
jgi:hypothetical protein